MCVVCVITENRELSDLKSLIPSDHIIKQFTSCQDVAESAGWKQTNIVIIDVALTEDVEIFMNDKVMEHMVVIILASQDMTAEIASKWLYLGATWVLEKPLSIQTFKAVFWRATQVSQGMNLLGKAGRLSNDVRKKLQESLKELSEMRTGTALQEVL